MKKVISLFLSVILMLSLSGQAFSKKDKTIDFRGIPFGTPYEEVKKLLEEENIFINIDSISHGTAPYFYDDGSMGRGKGMTIKDSFECRTTKGVPVAGTTASTDLFFIYIDKTDSEDPPIEGAVLYKATYRILGRTNPSTLSEYKIKLESIYGEPSAQDYFFSDWYKSYIWKGDNETYVTLGQEAAPDRSATIYLTYVWAKGNDIILERYNEIIKEKSLSSGVNGL